MALRIRLEFLGEVQLDRTLARLGEHIGDARPAWRALATRFGVLNAAQFATEGLTGSGGWQALSPDYAAWKARHYPGRPILERTGDLKRSLTRRPFGVEVLEDRFMVLGSDVDYGRYHQAGGPRLPQRRPVELPESERREWARILQRFVVTGEA